jgi:hypothetical protein
MESTQQEFDWLGVLNYHQQLVYGSREPIDVEMYHLQVSTSSW